jgi:hypothetical protein
MNAAVHQVIHDKRALLAQVSHRKVRALAAESNPFAAALFGVLLERKPAARAWDHAEWNAAIGELDASELTVGEWLEQEARR